jgi:hypothetical protein
MVSTFWFILDGDWSSYFFLNRNGFGEGNDTNQGCRVFLFYEFFGGFSLEKIILRITIYSNIFIFNWKLRESNDL